MADIFEKYYGRKREQSRVRMIGSDRVRMASRNVKGGSQLGQTSLSEGLVDLRKQSMQISERRMFQAERKAGAKSLKDEHAWLRKPAQWSRVSKGRNAGGEVTGVPAQWEGQKVIWNLRAHCQESNRESFADFFFFFDVCAPKFT